MGFAGGERQLSSRSHRAFLSSGREKYKERYRWRLRSSFQTGNPFGKDLAAIAEGIGPMIQGAYAFSGAIATTSDAPFVDIDVVDVFVLNRGERQGCAISSRNRHWCCSRRRHRPSRWQRLRSRDRVGRWFWGRQWLWLWSPAETAFYHSLRRRRIHVLKAGRSSADGLAGPSLFGSLRPRRT